MDAGYGYQSCSNCGIPATKFCVCRDTATPLCDNCVPTHEYYLHNEMHDLNPIAHLGIFYNLGGATAFRMQKRQLMQGSTLIGRLEECEMRQYLLAKQRLEATTRQYSDWLDYLHRCFTALVANFQYEKSVPMTTTVFQLSQFSFCIYSAGDAKWPQEGKLVEEDPLGKFESEVASLQVRLHQNCGYNNAFEEYYVSKIKDILQPPSYSSSFPSSQAVPAFIPPSPSPPKRPEIRIVPKQFKLFVPFSRGKQLARWDSTTTNLDQVTLSKSLNLTNLTVGVVLPDGNVVFCGGKGDHEFRAVLVDPVSGNVTSLPDMTCGRSNPGLVYADNMLFLFGGFQSGGITKLDSAEKFAFQNQTWTPIRDKMSSPRYQFTPCEFGRKAYLAGGWDTNKVDVFDLGTERFSTLPFTLPKVFGTTALAFNNELIILQDSRLVRWRIGATKGDPQVQQLTLSAKDSNVCPQIFGTKAYYTRETDAVCEIHQLELTTWQVTKVANLSRGPGMPQCPVE